MINFKLDRYSKTNLEKDHKEQGIFSLSQALELLHRKYINGLIDKDEYEILVKGEKEFWSDMIIQRG